MVDGSKKKKIYIYIYIHTHTITHDLSLILFLSAWIMDNVTADGTFFFFIIGCLCSQEFCGQTQNTWQNKHQWQLDTNKSSTSGKTRNRFSHILLAVLDESKQTTMANKNIRAPIIHVTFLRSQVNINQVQDC